MCSARDDAALPAPGLPIRVSADQRLFSAYPRLIAAVHALHRLLVPRHPPSALTILTVIAPASTRAGRAPPAGTVISVRWLSLCGFQGPRRGERARARPSQTCTRRSLKTRQQLPPPRGRAGPVDIREARPRSLTAGPAPNGAP